MADITFTTHLSWFPLSYAAGLIPRLLASNIYSLYPQNSVDDEPLCKPARRAPEELMCSIAHNTKWWMCFILLFIWKAVRVMCICGWKIHRLTAAEMQKYCSADVLNSHYLYNDVFMVRYFTVYSDLINPLAPNGIYIYIYVVPRSYPPDSAF